MGLTSRWSGPPMPSSSSITASPFPTRTIAPAHFAQAAHRGAVHGYAQAGRAAESPAQPGKIKDIPVVLGLLARVLVAEERRRFGKDLLPELQDLVGDALVQRHLPASHLDWILWGHGHATSGSRHLAWGSKGLEGREGRAAWPPVERGMGPKGLRFSFIGASTYSSSTLMKGSTRSA